MKKFVTLISCVLLSAQLGWAAGGGGNSYSTSMDKPQDLFSKVYKLIEDKKFDLAYKDNHDYFYQIGDDIKMLTPWVDKFIEILSGRDNKGVVGGCHDANYYGRINQKKTPVIENAFVHRKHYQIFNTFFNKSIENWYCDDWITEVYKPNLSTLCVDIKVVNTIMARYHVKDIGGDIKEKIMKDRIKINV